MVRCGNGSERQLMRDVDIIDLYWERDERAIGETARAYGRQCHAIAYRILNDARDADECVNDTYLGAWNAMPPQRPNVLSAFLGKITRNLSLKRWRARSAQKRGAGAVALSLDELSECLADAGGDVVEKLEAEELARLINAYLSSLPGEQRRVFLCRYWHFDSVAEIAVRFGFTESKVKMICKRTRDNLAAYLEKEGVAV